MTDDLTPDTNFTHARTFAHLTPEHVAALLTIAQRLGIAYEMAPHTEAVMPQDREFDFSQFHKERDGLFAFINTLLAERAVEIERLKARQITPDMEAAYDEVSAWWNAGVLPTYDDLRGGVSLERKFLEAASRAMGAMKRDAS